jgi:hypothetical protein
MHITMTTSKKLKPFLIAYCWRRGQIGFAKKLPEGAIQLGTSRDHKLLREKVEAIARHAYDHKTLLVPGVPETDDDKAAVAAVSEFIRQLEKRIPNPNANLAELAYKAVCAGAGNVFTGAEEDIAFLLGNLRHLCDREGFDFAKLDKSAYLYYSNSRSEYGALKHKPNAGKSA